MKWKPGFKVCFFKFNVYRYTTDDEGFDLDDDEDEAIPPEESLLIRTGHSRQVAWLSNIREWWGLYSC
jgi:hypothetical protein